jgi:hypothetical protein
MRKLKSVEQAPVTRTKNRKKLQSIMGGAGRPHDGRLPPARGLSATGVLEFRSGLATIRASKASEMNLHFLFRVELVTMSQRQAKGNGPHPYTYFGQNTNVF